MQKIPHIQKPLPLLCARGHFCWLYNISWGVTSLMDIFVQKDSTCFPNYLKLNHHKLIKGVKQAQNNITTILLGIQDVEVTGATKKRFIIIMCAIHERLCPHCSSFHVQGVQLLQDARCDKNTCSCSRKSYIIVLKLYNPIAD